MKKGKLFLLYFPAIFLVVSAMGVGGYFYYKYQELAKSPVVQSQEDFNKTLEAVGKLMHLPTDETPSVATITDVEKLRETEPFFEKAENGDRLISYSQALKAILYRPSENKIVDVVPLVIKEKDDQGGKQDSSAEERPSSQGPAMPAEEKKTVAIFNGTGNLGLGQSAKDLLVEQYEEKYSLAEVANASLDTYEQTTVVDLSGGNGEEASELANIFGGVVSSLPAGETAPDADLLVILGSSWVPVD